MDRRRLQAKNEGDRFWSARMYPASVGVAISWPEWNARVDDVFLCRPAGHGDRSSGHHEPPLPRQPRPHTPDGFQVVYGMLMR